MNLMVVDLTIFPWKLYFSLGQAFDTSIPMFVGLKVFKLAMVFIGETTWCSYSCRYMTTVAFFMDLWVSDGESAGSPRSDGANGCASYGWYRRSWKAKRPRSPRAKPSWCPISWRKLRTSPSTDIFFLFDCLTSCWTNKTFFQDWTYMISHFQVNFSIYLGLEVSTILEISQSSPRFRRYVFPWQVLAKSNGSWLHGNLTWHSQNHAFPRVSG